MSDGIAGTAGYAQEAEALILQYEGISFDAVHADLLEVIPRTPSVVLDIGSGTGRDAAHLALLGHRVVAVEPTDELRLAASRLHPSPSIEWIDDALPELRRVVARAEAFDLVMLTAVWMHLDGLQRQRAMPVVASLVRPGGVLTMSLRHGPVPAGRQMFDVSAEETVALALTEGLDAVVNVERGSLQEPNKSAGVSWTCLAFRKRRN